MMKKEVTREERFEDYRNSIENCNVDTKNVSFPKNKKSKKPNFNPLILEHQKQMRKTRISYYLFVSLFAILTIFILIYFGVKIYG